MFFLLLIQVIRQLRWIKRTLPEQWQLLTNGLSCSVYDDQQNLQEGISVSPVEVVGVALGLWLASSSLG
jgi:hypothetical protein